MYLIVFQEINKPQLHGLKHDGADTKCSSSPGSSAFPCLGCDGARGGTVDVGLFVCFLWGADKSPSVNWFYSQLGSGDVLLISSGACTHLGPKCWAEVQQ